MDWSGELVIMELEGVEGVHINYSKKWYVTVPLLDISCMKPCTNKHVPRHFFSYQNNNSSNQTFFRNKDLRLKPQ